MLHEAELNATVLAVAVLLPCIAAVFSLSLFAATAFSKCYGSTFSQRHKAVVLRDSVSPTQLPDRSLRHQSSEHPLTPIKNHFPHVETAIRSTQLHSVSLATHLALPIIVLALSLARLFLSGFSFSPYPWPAAGNVSLCVVSLYMIFLAALRRFKHHEHNITQLSSNFLMFCVVVSLCIINLGPYFTQSYPKKINDLSENKVGIAQTVLALFVYFIMLVTPTCYTPNLPNIKVHPQQTASPLSYILFTYLDPILIRFYLNPLPKSTSTKSTPSHGWISRAFAASPTTESPDASESDSHVIDDVYSHKLPELKTSFQYFLEMVPPLPDFLHCQFVLSQFRWQGDSQVEYSGQTCGSSREFARIYKSDVISVLGIALLWVIWTFASPLSMNLLLRHLEKGDSIRVSPYLFVTGLLLGPVFTSICFQQSLYMTVQLGLRLRVVLSHAIYTKLMRMKVGVDASSESTDSPSQKGDPTGRMNNLVGTDVDAITAALPSFIQLLAVPFKLIVSLTYLYILLGWSAFVAFGTIVAFVYPSFWVSKQYGAVQEKIMHATDNRISLISEMLASMRIIKTFAWERPMIDRVLEARSQELQAIKDRAKVFAGLMFLSTGVPASVCLTTFASYTFGQRQTLTASVAFTSLSLFGLLREAIISSTYLSSSFIRARVSLDRVSDFIQNSEDLDEQSSNSKTPQLSSPSTLDDIVISGAKFYWNEGTSSDSWNLNIEALKIPRNHMTVIAGHVGSGKTALLHAFLGELHMVSGSVYIPHNCSISYASQEPWLQNTTIRENILFGSEYDRLRYRKTLKQCALLEDLSHMPEGDFTVVGDRGLLLSGGQKQRISLARAIYAYSDTVILDDVLSAVDSGTMSHLVKYCLNGSLLRGRTVILVTHQLELCCRSPSCAQVIQLQDGEVIAQGHPAKVFEDDSLRDSRRRLHRRTTTSLDVGGGDAEPEKNKEGTIDNDIEPFDEAGDMSTWGVRATYLCAMGGVVFWICYAVVNIAAHLLMLGQGAWVGNWVNAPDRDQRLGFYFTVYAIIQILCGVFLTLMYLYLIAGAVSASKKIHRTLVQRIFAAPLGWFDQTPFGQIVNRFSKDTEVLDTEVIESLQPVFDYGAQVALVAITISAILPIFFLPAIFISVLFYFIGRLYIYSALCARKHIASARSPIFATLADGARGAVTIRAFRRVSHFVDKFKSQINAYNEVQLYQFGLDRWIEERSDAIGALVAFIVGILALSGKISIGTTGFLVSTGLEFTSRILYVVKAFNQNELNVNNVARILQYTMIDQEPSYSERMQLSSWPTRGYIQVENLSARYKPDLPDVLKNISFQIPEGGKVALVGRTGCGKSTLALAFLRFIHINKGRIRIDGRDIQYVSLNNLRSGITLIPQDPILFSGTLRSNLDPFDEHDDERLLHALELSGYTNGNRNVNLDMSISREGGNFSQGQRQILSLARALVRESKVIILDEATASVDPETDAMIQHCIRDSFKDATVITIAHRLSTIMDYDRVMVLQDGKMAEYDTPLALLEKEKGIFKTMCYETGSFENLLHKAKHAT